MFLFLLMGIMGFRAYSRKSSNIFNTITNGNTW